MPLTQQPRYVVVCNFAERCLRGGRLRHSLWRRRGKDRCAPVQALRRENEGRTVETEGADRILTPPRLPHQTQLRRSGFSVLKDCDDALNREIGAEHVLRSEHGRSAVMASRKRPRVPQRHSPLHRRRLHARVAHPSKPTKELERQHHEQPHLRPGNSRNRNGTRT